MTKQSSPSLIRKPIPELDTFLKVIQNDPPVGTSLRYELIYDEIRLSRQEDDPRLSMGIWKTDLKRADWNKIETLCIDALINKTKDLQISVWLTEAWVCLDGIQGYTRGLN
jgi:type VI secretion system protein ImpA